MPPCSMVSIGTEIICATQPIIICTDRETSEWLLNLADACSQPARWQLLLLEYDFDVAH